VLLFFVAVLVFFVVACDFFPFDFVDVVVPVALAFVTFAVPDVVGALAFVPFAGAFTFDFAFVAVASDFVTVAFVVAAGFAVLVFDRVWRGTSCDRVSTMVMSEQQEEER
jgi:hypothetical protein